MSRRKFKHLPLPNKKSIYNTDQMIDGVSEGGEWEIWRLTKL